MVGKEFSRYLVCLIKTLYKIFRSLFLFSLMARVLFVLMFASTPFQVQAGLLSFILGQDTNAEDTVVDSTHSSQTSGNMPLLESNISSNSVLQDKNDIKKGEDIDTNAKVNIVSDNALLSVTNPMSVSSGGIGSGDVNFEDISVYVVRTGDTISQVAEMFDVSVDTILSANNMNKGDKLKVGDVLLILPFSGVEHTVTKGQTLQGIANSYKVDLNEILLANDIEKNAKLTIGERLMIPGAGILSETKPKSAIGSAGGGSSSSMPSVAGYFKNPVPNGKKSRGITSSHRGVDIAAPTGTPIYAAASGKVLTARMGWNGAYGNMIILQHSNGTRTLYAHMSKLDTATGAQVSQGEVIGYVGSTGRSTGPHLHFEVLGAKNPF